MMTREAISTQNPIFTKLAGPGALDASGQVHATWARWLAQLGTEPPPREDDSCGPGWSPVRYDPPKRTEANAREIFALVLDHNLHSTWDRVCKLWSSRCGVVYTVHVANATDGDDRFRVVLPLARAISLAEYDHLWHWASVQACAANCPVDPQTYDATRFWPDPVPPPGGWRSQELTGSPLDPDAVLAEVEEVAPRGGTVPPSAEDTEDVSELEELDIADAPSDATDSGDGETDEPKDSDAEAAPTDPVSSTSNDALEEDNGATPDGEVEPGCEAPSHEPEPATAPA